MGRAFLSVVTFKNPDINTGRDMSLALIVHVGTTIYMATVVWVVRVGAEKFLRVAFPDFWGACFPLASFGIAHVASLFEKASAYC